MDADIALIRADNPSPLTLEGTNTWVVGRDPCLVVDPGPALPAHVEAVAAEVRRRGGAAWILLTHDHLDHAGAVEPLRALLSDPPLAAARHPGAVDPTTLGDGHGFRAVPTPGHAPDHLAYLFEGDVAATGDAVLGSGSVFIAPDPGALRGYLEALGALRSLGLRHLLPGHGPRVDDPEAKLDQYVSHRLARERALLDALRDGLRSIDALLDRAWADVPPHLRLPATVTLAAHLDKLEEEDRLPGGVERPDLAPLRGRQH
jgi:glyoxylase-like metal-dependent hydrolase (beta-lactamase superfamily II)